MTTLPFVFYPVIRYQVDEQGNTRVATCRGQTTFKTNCTLNRRATCDGGLWALQDGQGHGMTFKVPKEQWKRCNGHLWLAILPNTNYTFILEIRPCQQCRMDYVQKGTDNMFSGIIVGVVESVRMV